MGSILIQPRKRGASDKRLTPQQRQFVQHIIADPAFNLTEAAKAAGYKLPSQAANTLMKNPIVSAAIGNALHKRLQLPQFSELTAERVLLELGYIALANPQQLIAEDGSVLPLEEMPEHIARTVSSIKVKNFTDEDGQTTTTTEICFWSKISALELLSKHMGLLKERVEHSMDPESALMIGHLLNVVESQGQTVIDVSSKKA